LIIRFDENTPAYSSVTNWLRHLYLGEDIFVPGIHPDKPWDSLINFKILMELTAFPFHSVQTLALTLAILRSTIQDHLRKWLSVIRHSQ
jgi:hypothetical protein